MARVRIRYIGLLSDPNYGYGQYELFESLDRARTALEHRYRQGWDTSNEDATQVIDLGGERSHVDFGVLTRQAKIELWPTLAPMRREDVVRLQVEREVSLLEDVEPYYEVTLGPQQGSIIHKLSPAERSSLRPDHHPWRKNRPTIEGES